VVEVLKVVKVEELLQVVVVVANLAEIKTQGKVKADRVIKNVNPILKEVLAKKSPHHLIALYKKTSKQRNALTLYLLVSLAFILKKEQDRAKSTKFFSGSGKI
jgi:hypothetical protein